jgi:hypothetical protein
VADADSDHEYAAGAANQGPADKMVNVITLSAEVANVRARAAGATSGPLKRKQRHCTRDGCGVLGAARARSRPGLRW